MNRNAKALRTEGTAIAILTADGYVVHRTVRTPYRGGQGNNGNDVFGCIDVIAKKAGQRMRYIQVTGDRAIGRKKAKLATVPWDVVLESVEIWRWIDGTGPKTDGRNGATRDRMYFQVYRLDLGYEPDAQERVRLGVASAPWLPVSAPGT